MTSIPALKQLILGDFRERTRSYSFLLTLLGTMFFGYLVITDQYSVRFSEYRGEFNGAWEGTLMAVSCSIMLTIFGFYLVKNSIRRDRLTNVGQTLASGSMTKLTYLSAKALSNCLVLLTMVGILAVGALVMLLLVDVDIDINLWYLISPFILITVPAMTLVAAIAVLFESIRWLRGSLGNVLYLFTAEGMILSGMWKRGTFDIAGIGLFTESAKEAIQAAYPGAEHSMIMGFIRFDPAIRDMPLRTFAWSGIDWTGELLLSRLGLIMAACLAVVIAVPFFDRFDPASVRSRLRRPKEKPSPLHERSTAATHGTRVPIATLPSPGIRFSLITMIGSELRLMTKGYHWFWYMIALGLLAAQLATPYEMARMYFVPASVVWCLTIWSGMGSRENQFNTRELLISSPRPLMHQFPSAWAAGFAVAFLAVSGMIVRASITGDMAYVAALLSGAMFIPSMALCFGTVSNSRKLFEVIFLMLWYIGTIEHLTSLDFLGTTRGAISTGMPLVFSLLGIGFLLTAFIARRRQMVL
jgi:hypothetical protein